MSGADIAKCMQRARVNAPEICWSYCNREGLIISRIMVCKSAAGYYPGRMCYDSEAGFVEPYDREKMYGYFPTEDGAQRAVEEFQM